MSRNARPPRSMRLYPTSASADMAAAPTNIAAAPLRDFWLSEQGDCGSRFDAIQSALDEALGAAA